MSRRASRTIVDPKTICSKDVKQLFQPLVTDIQKLVDDLVQEIRVKRLGEHQAQGEKTKVC